MGPGFALVGRLGRHLLHLGVAIVAAGTVVLALTVTDARTASTLDLAEAVQQLSSALGVAVLGTIFFSAFGHHLPTHAIAITAWACLAPIAAAFALIFRLPMGPRATTLTPLGKSRLRGAPAGPEVVSPSRFRGIVAVNACMR
jgi:hypothetical protein